jgi:hypothetical protein
MLLPSLIGVLGMILPIGTLLCSMSQGFDTTGDIASAACAAVLLPIMGLRREVENTAVNLLSLA